MPCSRSGSTTPTGTTASNTTPRRRPASGSVFCGSWRRPARRWWPLTCRSRPSAMWRSPATSFVGYRPSGITDRLLDWAELEHFQEKWEPVFRFENATTQEARPHAFEQRGLSMILGMSVGAFTILHVIITLVAIGSGLIVVGGMFASNRLPVTLFALYKEHLVGAWRWI